MLCPLDWQLVNGVVVYHLSDAVERLTELAQYEPTFTVHNNFHVHETG
jgi:hypothetical protein